MRGKNVFVIAFTVLLILILCQADLLAMETGFSTESISDEETSTIRSNLHITVLNNEPEKKPISCFAVKDNGDIAIGYTDSVNNKRIICVYSSEGCYKYGYSIENSGVFGLEFDNDFLLIYFVRSRIVISINRAGTIEEILRIKETEDNNAYWQYSVFAKRRVMNGVEHIMRNKMGIINIFASDYSELLVRSSSGEETVIYDASSAQSSKMVFFALISIVLLCITVKVIIRELKMGATQSIE